MDSKGIFNIELFISLMILLIIFAMIISFSIEEFSSFEETQNRKESRVLVSDITEIIMDVYIKGDGFSRRYELPSKINEETYILQINESGVYINSHYQITYSQTFSKNILKSKKYILKPGYVYEFRNINNSIEIIQNN
ncbi:MAG: hypothetical protein E7Z85_02010 [Methanosphaera stadtmanae]|nr:hypothetical protein [Methanosphaera stadtmanae]